MPTISSLHDFLRDHGDAVIERWRHRVQEHLGIDDLSRAELVDEMPAFMAELVAALTSAATSDPPNDSRVASEHGPMQRPYLFISPLHSTRSRTEDPRSAVGIQLRPKAE